MILVDAIYINSGGGNTLLKAFLNNLYHYNYDYVFLIDRRNKYFLNDFNLNNIYFVNSNERSRGKIYSKIIKTHNIEKIFILNNIPPPFKIYNLKVYIYFHNVLLINPFGANYNFFKISIFILKYIYILSRNSNKYIWITQTEYLKNLLRKSLYFNVNKILVLPFFNDNANYNNIHEKIYKFIYVADGSSQKNHKLIFETLFFLANKYRIYPNLHLTFDPIIHHKLNNILLFYQSKGLKLINHGTLNDNNLKQLYSQSEFLIYPSLKESFGLPLIEAILNNCNVIAINMPYVQSTIKPSFYFKNKNDLVEIILKLNLNNDYDKSKILVQNKIDDIFQLFKN